MKKLFITILATTLIAAPYTFAGEDYSPNLWGQDPYNQPDSFTRDFDGDGTPNFVDPFNDDFTVPPAFRDYDNDGTPNFVDPFDDDFYKP